jgi:hypothetical protein
MKLGHNITRKRAEKLMLEKIVKLKMEKIEVDKRDALISQRSERQALFEEEYKKNKK